LANRAIWHNKAKYKNFGELFRSGDTVAVILDLDVGTLSFILNGVDLGVAVDGLAGMGPFYPAFSLYNEDDQLSILPPSRASASLDTHPSPPGGQSHTQLGGGSAGSWSGGIAERVLDRLHTLQELAAYFFDSYHAGSNNNGNGGAAGAIAVPPSSVFSMSNSVISELANRLKLWQIGVGIRSFMWKNDFISVVSSKTLCARLCADIGGGIGIEEQLLSVGPGDIVTIDGVSGRVLGVGSHRLWLEMCVTAEVIGYCKDSVAVMMASGSIVCIAPSQHSEDLVVFEDDSKDDSKQQALTPTSTATLSETPSQPASSGPNDGTDGVQTLLRLSSESLEDDLEEDVHIGVIKAAITERADVNGPHQAVPNVNGSKSGSRKTEVSVRKARRLDVLRGLLIQQSAWTRADDMVLVQWINMLMSVNYVHPTFVSLSVALQSRKRFIDAYEQQQALRQDEHSFISYFGSFLQRHSEDAIAFRMMLIFHLNDVCLPLLPLTCAGASDHISANAHHKHPTALLAHHTMKHLLLHTVKCSFAARVAQVSGDLIPSVQTQAHTPAQANNDEERGDNSSGTDGTTGGPMILYVCDEQTVAQNIWTSVAQHHASNNSNGNNSPANALGGGAHPSSAQANLAADVFSPSFLLLHTHSSWRLVSAFQASYVGQLFAFLESVATNTSPHTKYSFVQASGSTTGANGQANAISPAASADTHQQPPQQDNASVWENLLRARTSPAISLLVRNANAQSQPTSARANMGHSGRSGGYCEAVMMSTSVSLQAGYVEYEADHKIANTKDFLLPFIIRSRQTHGSANCESISQKKDINMLDLALRLAEVNSNSISERFVFELFLEQAFQQVEQLLTSIFGQYSDAPGTRAENSIGGTTMCDKDPATRIIECLPVLFLSKGADNSDSIQLITQLKASDVNIIFQIVHVVGVLVGLKLRYSLPTCIQLPELFVCLLATSAVRAQEPNAKAGSMFASSHDELENILLGLFGDVSSPGDIGSSSANEKADSGVRVRAYQFAVCLGLTLRHGVTTIVPDACLALWQEQELADMLLRGSCRCTSPTLIRNHIRAQTVGSNRSSPQLEFFFFAALYELSPLDIRAILTAVWSDNEEDKNSNVYVCDLDELWVYNGFRSLPKPLTLMQASEPSTISDSDSGNLNSTGDNSGLQDMMEITINKAEHALVIPMYSSLAVMVHNLQLLLLKLKK
jgi:hypothetical protein